ncbi:hypothetical protein RFF05_02710 [Bengtsoniella intestinalis]|uniref:hypothetical protein n=1 Tax=Bengtsoniella intestinalis TaxID=3073143 RepID=UPI00391F28E8
MEQKEEILDYLGRELGCSILSNLHAPRYHLKEKKYFEWASMQKYSLEEWQYAYQYIVGMDSTATTLQELRAEFLNHL